jgi:4-carboxymuconolactone decarboxylase
MWSRKQGLSAKNCNMIIVTALVSDGNFEQLVPHLKKARETGVGQVGTIP